MCLHRRYCSIADQLGCSSYWIDTACIPSDHDLRQKAISTINQVFTTSHATLVCDRDIMDIDISDICDGNDTSPSSVALMESILATVLVCDWNLRTRRQALPQSQERVFEGSYDGSMTAERLSSGFVTVSEAASLLGQRFASRAGDDVIIWSLLIGDSPQKDAQDIWARGQDGGARVDRYIHTGHLVSSVARLASLITSSQGVSWAPSRPGPYLVSHDETTTSSLYPPYDGSQSRLGKIELGNGGIKYLRATWGVATIRFEHGLASSYQGFHGSINSKVTIPVPEKLKEILTGYEGGKLLQPLNTETPKITKRLAPESEVLLA
ncbi:hypothetical protein VP1G_10741 [Cytospora mali]|uniref:Heterokaryon incompatibility domain-containing protein n=1 Tax=Cytospora mali TaxID=578113 RepID=A0A194UUZ9_CYTMA|nr:hypothetical protein VP1G_10741 [Valsa mali var. pyri (nom. inval.)]